MSVALDFGTYRLKSLSRRNQQLVGRGCRTVYTILPDTRSRRQLLDQLHIRYATCEENLVIMGDAAAEFGRLFQVPSMSLLPKGKVPPHNPPIRQMLASLVETLIPRSGRPNEICCMTLPGATMSGEEQTDDRESEFLAQLVRLRGYRPLVLGSGMAVVLAELVQESFTGIGLTFGAASCDVSLAHRGVELVRCSVPRGGNWIDERLARANERYAWDARGQRYLDLDGVTQWKEAFTGSIFRPRTEQEQLLADCYRELLAEVCGAAAQTLAGCDRRGDIPQPLTLVGCGGTARIPGFVELFRQTLRETDFPINIGDIRLVTDSDYTTARGCLINAELETETTRNRRAAA